MEDLPFQPHLVVHAGSSPVSHEETGGVGSRKEKIW